MSDIVPYTDTDPMPFGKHVGVPLQDVPAQYLLWLYTKRPLSDKRLEAYLTTSFSALRKECPDWMP